MYFDDVFFFLVIPEPDDLNDLNDRLTQIDLKSNVLIKPTENVFFK